MLRSAEVMHLVARRAAEFGVEIDGAVRFSLERAVARTDAIVGGIIHGIHERLNQRSDRITLVRGRARFIDEHQLDVDGRRASFAKAIVATGARRVTPPVTGLIDGEYLTNRSALHLERLPTHLIVIGAGYVGIEFAQMYARFGSRVTLFGRNPQLAPGEDVELAGLLAGYLREEGIDVHTEAAVSTVRREDGDYVVQASVARRRREFRCDGLLVAAGRVGNTDGLGLAEAGVETDERGFVTVDDHLRTSRPHVWAIGDVKGGWMFTHVATYDGPIAALNAVKGLNKTVDYRVVPRAVFSDPTLAAVGVTEQEARARGHDVAVGSVTEDGARAMAIGDRRGRLKAVVDRASNEILGFHILAPHGDDLLHEGVAAMHNRGQIDRIGKSIHVHPTLSEMVKSAARAAK